MGNSQKKKYKCSINFFSPDWQSSNFKDLVITTDGKGVEISTLVNDF